MMNEKSLGEKYTAQALEHVANKNFEEALEFAGNSLVQCISKNGLTSLKTADSHFLLGYIYLNLREYEKCLAEMKVCRTLRRKYVPEKSLDIAVCDILIGKSEIGLKNYQSAFHSLYLSWYKRALQLGFQHQSTMESRVLVQTVRYQTVMNINTGTHLSKNANVTADGSPIRSKSPVFSRKNNNDSPLYTSPIASHSSDQWVHKYELFDRLEELKWKHQSSNNILFKIAVSLQYNLFTDGSMTATNQLHTQYDASCVLASKLKTLIRGVIVHHMDRNGVGVGTGMDTSSPAGSVSVQDCESVGSYSLESVSDFTSIDEQEPQMGNLCGLYDPDLDIMVQNVLKTLLVAAKTLTCGHLMMNQPAVFCNDDMSPNAQSIANESKIASVILSDVPSSLNSDVSVFNTVSPASKAMRYEIPVGLKLDRTEDDSDSDEDFIPPPPAEQLNCTQPELQTQYQLPVSVPLARAHSAPESSPVVAPENMSGYFVPYEADPTPTRNPTGIANKLQTSSRGCTDAVGVSPHSKATVTPQKPPVSPSPVTKKTVTYSNSVDANYESRYSRFGSNSSTPLSVTRSRNSPSNSNTKKYVPGMSLEVSRLNESWAEQQSTHSVPRFSCSPLSSTAIPLSADELLSLSKKAGVGSSEEECFKDILSGGDWSQKRLPCRLLSHQTHLDTFDADGRPVVVTRKGDDRNATVSSERMLLTEDMLKQRSVIISANLIIAWLRALPELNKRDLGAADGDKANFSNKRASLSSAGRRFSAVARRLSQLEVAAKQPAPVVENASKQPVASTGQGKKKAIPRPPPLPTIWPPVFDEKHNLVVESARSAGWKRSGTGNVANNGTASGKTTPAPPKVKQVQWETLTTVEGTLWESAEIADINYKTLFADVESDFAIAPKKKPAVVMNVGKGGVAKFNPLDLLSAAKGLNSTKGDGDSKSKSKKGNGNEALIDVHRAQNINIMLVKFNRITMEALSRGVMGLDANLLDSSAVTALQQFIPTAEESSLLQKHARKVKDYASKSSSNSNDEIEKTVPPVALGKAELYLLAMSKVPKLEMRLSALWFCLTIKETINSLEQSSQTIFTAVEEVKGSKRLQCILRVVLELGNVLKNDGVALEENQSSAISRGFKISSFNNMIKTKSNKNENILEYCVAKLYTKYPEMLQISSEMKSLGEAMRISFPKMNMELNKIKSGLDNLIELYKSDKEAYEARCVDEEKSEGVAVTSGSGGVLEVDEPSILRMESMISDFSIKIKALEESVASATSDFDELCVYLGEPPGSKGLPGSSTPSTTPEILFGHLQSFVGAVTTATNTSSARIRRQNRLNPHK